MEIADIKQNLSLSQVLENYSLQPNKNNMLRCPFHEDSTASLQVSFSQNRYKCPRSRANPFAWNLYKNIVFYIFE